LGGGGEVEHIYALTHSPAYEASMNALETLSPAANWLADRISWIPGISLYAESLRQIGGAASYMRIVYDASEEAYQAVQAVEAAPKFLEYGITAGLALIIVGVALIVRARRSLNV